MEAQNTRMTQSFKNCDFALACLFLHWVLEFNFFVNFNGVPVLIAIVDADSYLSVCALAYALTNLIVL